MDDIHMGDTHLITLNDCTIDDEDSCDQYVALIVAQHRNQFDFTALDYGMFNINSNLSKIFSFDQLSKLWEKVRKNSKHPFIYLVLVLVQEVTIFLILLNTLTSSHQQVSIGMVPKN